MHIIFFMSDLMAIHITDQNIVDYKANPSKMTMYQITSIKHSLTVSVSAYSKAQFE